MSNRFSLFIFIFLFLIYELSLGQDKKTQKQLRGSGVEKGTIKKSSYQKSFPLKIVYFDVENYGESNEKSLLFNIGKPKSYNKDGIYIWRENDSIWNLGCISKTHFSIEITISSNIPLDILDLSSGEVSLNLDGNNSFTISGMSNDRLQIAKFKTKGKFINFDILVDGERTTEKVFLGYLCKTPESLFFNLENPDIIKTFDDSIQTYKIMAETKRLNQIENVKIAQKKSSMSSGGGSRKVTTKPKKKK